MGFTTPRFATQSNVATLVDVCGTAAGAAEAVAMVPGSHRLCIAQQRRLGIADFPR